MQQRGQDTGVGGRLGPRPVSAVVGATGRWALAAGVEVRGQRVGELGRQRQSLGPVAGKLKQDGDCAQVPKVLGGRDGDAEAV